MTCCRRGSRTVTVECVAVLKHYLGYTTVMSGLGSINLQSMGVGFPRSTTPIILAVYQQLNTISSAQYATEELMVLESMGFAAAFVAGLKQCLMLLLCYCLVQSMPNLKLVSKVNHACAVALVAGQLLWQPCVNTS